jgi:hypothetical protein
VPELAELQEKLRLEMNHGDYLIETPIVYNSALDEVGSGSDIRFVLVADNPGKNEQLAKNRRNLVGQSGRLAEGFFRRELGIDFRKEVIIINKTPVHTARTAELRRLLSLAGRPGTRLRTSLEGLLEETQVEMAGFSRLLQKAFTVPLWISGYGELGDRGLFRGYSAALAAIVADEPNDLREDVWLFRHFSMNQFAIELRTKRQDGETLLEALRRIGTANRERILGW